MSEQVQQMQVPQLMLVARRVEQGFDAALLVNGQFDRSTFGESLTEVFAEVADEMNKLDLPLNSRVQISVNFVAGDGGGIVRP